jgi:hypothetical protein
VVVINAPSSVANPASLTVADYAVLGTANTAIGLNPRIFFVNQLANNHGGDTSAPINQPATGANYASFVAVSNAEYSAAHELGHSLTEDIPPADKGHYLQPAIPAGNRLIVGRNLMAGAHPAPPIMGENTRLWDAADANGFDQYTHMRGSRLAGPM